METKAIQKEIGKMEVLSNCVICENIEPLFGWEFDVLSLSKNGIVSEFEVKISRSDFKADKKKGKIEWYSCFGTNVKKVPNYFSYVCPEGLIKLEEIPDYAGLFYAKDNTIIHVRSPKLLHKVKHDRQRIVEKICRLTSERLYLGCARMTYENRLNKDRNNRILTP